MTKSTRFYCVVLGVLCILISASHAQQTPKSTTGQRFEFKYEARRPLAYSAGMKISRDMAMKGGTENLNMRTAFDLRYHLTLTPVADSKDGFSTMRFEASNIEADWDITRPTGHILLSLRGADMNGTQDGVVIIDTARGIGVAEAQDFKKEILPLYLSAQIDLDSRGYVKQFRGDMPFVGFWTDQVWPHVGFFGIVFPEHAIAVGETWQESVTLKNLGGVKLEGEELRVGTAFTRQPDVVVRGKRIATFDLSAPFSYKDLTALLEQMGQITRLNIGRFDRRATGTFWFDQDRGVLTDGTMKADADCSMNALVQGQALTMVLKMHKDTRINLLPKKTEPAQPDAVLVLAPLVENSEVPSPTKAYEVIKREPGPGTKCVLTVRLANPLAEEDVRSLALSLRSAESTEWNPLFVFYYLPDGIPGQTPAWAISHFKPELELKIMGLEPQQKKRFEDAARDAQGKVVGTWLEEEGIPHLLIIREEAGHLVLEERFKDGSHAETTLVPKSVDGKERLYKDPNNSFDDHMVIEKDGRLGLYDRQGFIRGLPPTQAGGR